MSTRVVAALATAALAACAGEAPKAPPVAAMAVTRAYVVLPAGASPAALYATIINGTPRADTLTAVELGDLAVMLHGADMTMLGAVPVAAGATERLLPGGRHGMITAFSGHARGDSLPLTFRFARGGAVVVKAHVIAYADVDTAAPPATPSR